VVIHPGLPVSAWDICLKMKENGILAKPTHDHIIRFTPPLVISEVQLMDAIERIKTTFAQVELSW
jgi:ornithine--oxo-acid transaminase